MTDVRAHRFSLKHFLRNAAAVALVVAAAIWFWRYGVRDHVIPRNFGVVEAGQIYRSGRLTPRATEQVVREHRIRTIIDLGAYTGDPVSTRVAEQTARALGVRRVVFTLEGDGTGDPQQYADALRIMTDPASQPVLIHCAAGAQRTSVCIMLYRRIFQGVPLEQSLGEAMEHRHDPRDNPALWAYVTRWADAIERAVRDGTPVDRTPPEAPVAQRPERR
jgi:hypothetical protein